MDKNAKTVVIGTLIATLMLTMLAAPAVAEINAELYVDVDYGSADDMRDETGVLLKYYGGEAGDLIQHIQPGPNGVIDPADCTDPNYIGGDDVLCNYYPTSYVGEEYFEDGKIWSAVWFPTVVGTEDVYYRSWNADTIENATYYGDSIIITLEVGNNEDDLLPSGTWWTDQPKPTPADESKLVSMSEGWNLISLCFEPSSNTTSNVLLSIESKYDAVKKWDASLDTWAEATTMDRGTGYFVHVTTTPCTWNHTGMNNTDEMTIPLETGLNLVGYPFNWNKDTGTALSALNYYYAAPFDASTQKYDKTYNPAAPMPPAPFNDFLTINPCEGFWVSSKDGGDWTAS